MHALRHLIRAGTVGALLGLAPAAFAGAPAAPPLGPNATAQPAHTYHVNTPVDVTPPLPSDCVNQTPGACSLRAAIMQANSDGTLDKIVVPAGTYALTIEPDSSTNDDASSGNLNITDPGGVELDGAGASTTTVDASAITDNVLAVGTPQGGPSVPALVQGLTFTGGNSVDGGGGIYNDYEGALTLSSDTVQGNSAAQLGGGIDNQGSLWLLGSSVSNDTAGALGGGIYSNGPLHANRATFDQNEAGYNGGGLFTSVLANITSTTFSGNLAASNGGGIYNDDTLQLDHVTVSDNQAGVSDSSGGGGGIYQEGVLLVLHASRVDGNVAPFGGGIGVDRGAARMRTTTVTQNQAVAGGGVFVSGPAALQVTRGSIDHDTAFQDGGGLYSNGETTMTNARLNANSAGRYGGGAYVGTYLAADRSTVSGNQASSDGGGIYDAFRLLLDDSTVSANTAGGHGGGIENAGAAHLANDTLTGNSAGGTGGGIDDQATVFSQSTPTTLSISEATINGNSAGAPGAGGGIATVAPMTVEASIVAQNTAGSGASDCNLQNGVSAISAGYNLESGTDCNFTVTGDQQNANPLLKPLGFHGGPTKTEPLQSGSPAINGAGTQCATPTDQRGDHRPARGACDVGAFEAQ